MGCSKGNLYTFDPLLMGEGKITRFYFSKPPCQKRRRVELVKWLEPYDEAEQNVQHFLCVYDDGSIYFFDSSKSTVVTDTSIQAQKLAEESEGLVLSM